MLLFASKPKGFHLGYPRIQPPGNGRNAKRIDAQCEKSFDFGAWAGDNTGMEYGERLRARARALGLTDTDVAKRLGLAQSRYANYVNGNREPDFATFSRICLALGTTPDEILGFNAEQKGDDDAMTERKRVLAALGALELPALKVAVVILEALVSRQNELPGAVGSRF